MKENGFQDIVAKILIDIESVKFSFDKHFTLTSGYKSPVYVDCRKIIIATFIEPVDVLTTKGVTEIMQNEAREDAEKTIQKAALIVKESTGIIPVLQIREGEIMKELKAVIDEEKNINVLVLAANVDEIDQNPGPIINSLFTKELSNLRVPVMIVPGNFSKDHIALIT